MRGGSALLEEEQGGLEVGRGRTDGRTDSSSAISAFDHGEEFSRAGFLESRIAHAT